MLTYEIISKMDTWTYYAAKEMDRLDDVVTRLYENDVELSYIYDKKENIVFILNLHSKIIGKGHGKNVLNEFLKEFNAQNIELDAVFPLHKWYKQFGFVVKYYGNDCCIHMELNRKE